MRRNVSERAEPAHVHIWLLLFVDNRYIFRCIFFHVTSRCLEYNATPSYGFYASTSSDINFCCLYEHTRQGKVAKADLGPLLSMTTFRNSNVSDWERNIRLPHRQLFYPPGCYWGIVQFLLPVLPSPQMHCLQRPLVPILFQVPTSI